MRPAKSTVELVGVAEGAEFLLEFLGMYANFSGIYGNHAFSSFQKSPSMRKRGRVQLLHPEFSLPSLPFL